jgi:hypothetical protein
MEITVSSKNEFRVVPDIMNNTDFEDKDRFAVIMRKLSSLESGEWSSVSADNKVFFDIRKKLKKAIVRLENAPSIKIDDTEVIPLTVDIILSGKYPELYSLETFLISEMTRLESEGVLDIKKS